MVVYLVNEFRYLPYLDLVVIKRRLFFYFSNLNFIENIQTILIVIKLRLKNRLSEICRKNELD